MELGLYETLSLNDTELYDDERIGNQKPIELFFDPEEKTKHQFDAYCIYCDKETTFRYSDDLPNYHDGLRRPLSLPQVLKREFIEPFPWTVNFKCLRDNSHNYSFIFQLGEFSLTKIGQSPSVADIESSNINKYKKLLKGDFVLLKKAIGLYSHGIGIGSFVYIRRILENLVQDKFEEVKTINKWNEEDFQNLRMEEKIKFLENELPRNLVENRKVYGIVSKGIHEMSEEECKDYFEDIKIGIELILTERLYKEETKKLEKKFRSFTSNNS